LYNKAVILNRLEKYEKFLECYDRYLELFPEDEKAIEHREYLISFLNEAD